VGKGAKRRAHIFLPVANSAICCLKPQRIDYFEKRETAEVGIARADLSDAVFAHENGGVGIVKDISCEIGQL